MSDTYCTKIDNCCFGAMFLCKIKQYDGDGANILFSYRIDGHYS